MTDQSVPAENTMRFVKIGTTDIANGFTTDGANVTSVYGGVYNYQFSLQLHNNGGGGSGNQVDIWLTKNGQTVANTNTRVDVITNSPYIVAAWNFLVDLEPGDKVGLAWSTNNVNIVIDTEGPISPHPAIPSAIVTIQQVARVLVPDVTSKANIVDLTTANVTEKTNLYFTNARVYANVTQMGYITSTNSLINGSYTTTLDSTGQLILPQSTQGGIHGGWLTSTSNVNLNAGGNLWKFGADGSMLSPYSVKIDRKSTRLNSSHTDISRMPSSA